jgi:predicted component of type VI protein secretion system
VNAVGNLEFSKYDYYLPNFKDLETFTVLLTIILGATILFALDYYDKKRAH